MNISRLTLILALTFISYINTAQAAHDNTKELLPKKLTAWVSQQKEKADLVGLGAMVMHHGEIIAGAVDGEREVGTDVALTIRDTWHIGSVTKSITATMIARLVEKDLLRWDTKIEDVFTDNAKINLLWRDVTLAQLLTHTAGAPQRFSFFSNLGDPVEGAERVAAREHQVLNILEDKPKTIPGSRFSYSNLGYIIAGAIAEKVTHLPWETLVTQEIFTTLKLSSGGFGEPLNRADTLEHPRGHSKFLGFLSRDLDDLSPVYGPAGTIHLSMEDLLTYANEHMQGKQGHGKLLSEKTYQHLHNPIKKSYAYGWAIKSNQTWVDGPIIWHNGSNGSWYTLLAFIPSLDLSIVVNSNEGNVSGAEKSAWKIIEQVSTLIQVENN